MRKTTENSSHGIQWGDRKLGDFDFGDDVALVSQSMEEIQKLTDDLGELGSRVGLVINKDKTKSMVFGNSQTSNVIINGESMENKKGFTYLGSYIQDDGDAGADVRIRIGKAAAVFRKLGPIWKLSSLNNNTKICLYMSIVVPTALYACETWKKTAAITRNLDVFHRRCLRSILHITWRDHVRNEEVMSRAGVGNLSDMVDNRRWKFAGHVIRMGSERLARTALEWIPEGGRRGRGRPKKTWRSTFSEDMMTRGTCWEEARSRAFDRGWWRELADQCSFRNGWT